VRKEDKVIGLRRRRRRQEEVEMEETRIFKLPGWLGRV
jgi:hypothetical protein